MSRTPHDPQAKVGAVTNMSMFVEAGQEATLPIGTRLAITLSDRNEVVHAEIQHRAHSPRGDLYLASCPTGRHASEDLSYDLTSPLHQIRIRPLHPGAGARLAGAEMRLRFTRAPGTHHEQCSAVFQADGGDFVGECTGWESWTTQGQRFGADRRQHTRVGLRRPQPATIVVPGQERLSALVLELSAGGAGLLLPQESEDQLAHLDQFALTYRVPFVNLDVTLDCMARSRDRVARGVRYGVQYTSASDDASASHIEAIAQFVERCIQRESAAMA